MYMIYLAGMIGLLFWRKKMNKGGQGHGISKGKGFKEIAYMEFYRVVIKNRVEFLRVMR